MPSEVRGSDLTYRALGQLLEADTSPLRERVEKRRGRDRFQPLLVRADLPYESLARVETHRYALPGVITEVRPRREYLEGDLAAHLLGTLGEVRADQLEKAEFQKYRQGEIVGQTGLEAALEPSLRGSAGGRNVIIDVAGREVERLDEVDPVPGSDVTLSIDLDLQRAAAEAFRSEDPENPDAPDKLGALVALDPRTGDVLAMISRPAFDPNSFAGGVDAETWHGLTKDENKPLQDRAVAGQYPPGSTYKPFLAAAGLETGVITPMSRVVCPGSFWFGNRSFKCWRKGGHGSVDLHTSLVRSCDVYYYQLGVRLGVDRIASFAKAFNLGHFGIQLPDEKPGLIPTSDWKLRRFRPSGSRRDRLDLDRAGLRPDDALQLRWATARSRTGLYEPRLVLEGGAPMVRRGDVAQDLRNCAGEARNLALIRKALGGVVSVGGTGARRASRRGSPARRARPDHPAEHFDGVKEQDPDQVPRPRVVRRFGAGDWRSSSPCFRARRTRWLGCRTARQKVLAKYFEKKGIVPPPKGVVTGHAVREEDEDPVIEDDSAVGGPDAGD
jgi:penicillin-binding protein 2